MGILTSRKIADLYGRFKEIDVTYTKEIVQVIGLQADQVHLKCVSDSFPCVIHSSSFLGAKVVANVNSGLMEKLQQTNNSVSLRFCFKNSDQGSPLTFFVASHAVGHAAYGGSVDAALFALQFTQRPPDDLIDIMGRFLDANINSTKRRDERIIINADTLRKLGILSNESIVFIQGAPRRCLLRDISFAEAKIVMAGADKSLEGQAAALRFDFQDPRKSFLIKGKFTQVEDVESRKDLLALVLSFDEAAVPMGYKMRLNDCLSTVRAGQSGEAEGASADGGKA
ncbi:cyclic di-GMP binding protein [Spirochaetia bacterium]|nr:cyclic di-GMP binding protein [Spirochaetia bacterium]